MKNFEKKYSATEEEKGNLEDNPIEKAELEEKIEGANQKINQEKAKEVLEKNQKRKEAIENTLSSISNWREEDFETQINNLETAIYELSLPNREYLNPETVDSLEDLKGQLNEQLQRIKSNLSTQAKSEQVLEKSEPGANQEKMQKSKTEEKTKKSLMGKVVNLFSFKRKTEKNPQVTEAEEGEEKKAA